MVPFLEAPMPFAIVVPHGSAGPVVLALSDCQKLLAALRFLFRSLPRVPGWLEDLPDAEAARRWLACQAEPSGWYECFEEVAGQLERLQAAGSTGIGRATLEGMLRSKWSTESR
jgi:hypothetical protein